MQEHVNGSNNIKVANEWLSFLMAELEWNDKYKVYRALCAVLQGLRDEMHVKDAADFGIRLPVLIRILYYEGWNNIRLDKRVRKENEFFINLKESLFLDKDVDIQLVVSAVFKLLHSRCVSGELDDINEMLPDKLKHLWPVAELSYLTAA